MIYILAKARYSCFVLQMQDGAAASFVITFWTCDVLILALAALSKLLELSMNHLWNYVSSWIAKIDLTSKDFEMGAFYILVPNSILA